MALAGARRAVGKKRYDCRVPANEDAMNTPAVPTPAPVTDTRLVAWVRQAAPYIHAFRGKTFVIAFGGEVLRSDKAEALIHDVALLDSMGIRLVLVHGARRRVSTRACASPTAKRWSASSAPWV